MKTERGDMLGPFDTPDDEKYWKGKIERKETTLKSAMCAKNSYLDKFVSGSIELDNVVTYIKNMYRRGALARFSGQEDEAQRLKNLANNTARDLEESCTRFSSRRGWMPIESGFSKGL